MLTTRTPTALRTALCFLLLLAGSPLKAETVQDMIKILESEGFVVTDIGRTFLGRIRIEAVSDGFVREVILSRSTGEIRQDAVFRKEGASASVGSGPADDVENHPSSNDNGSQGGKPDNPGSNGASERGKSSSAPGKG